MRTAHVLMLLGVWVMYTGMMFLHLFVLEEKIGRQAPLEEDDVANAYARDIHCYNWIGGAGWAMVWLAIVVCSLDHSAFGRAACVLAFVLGLVFWITLISLGFEAPSNQWRKYDLAKKGLEKGGQEFRGCRVSPDPTSLMVLPNVSYYVLVDDGWYVDFAAAQKFSEWGWTWLTAPIRYKGPVNGCRFRQDIRAVCIAKGPTPEKCGFQTGAFTMIRKLAVSEYVEKSMTKKLPYGGSERERELLLYEWNSQSYEFTKEYVAKMEKERDNMWRDVTISWLSISIVLTLGAILYFYYKTYEPPKSLKSLPSSQEERQKHGTELDATTEGEYVV